MNRLLVSAAHKSSGKTTVSLGLCAALTAQGAIVQPYKKGADYIEFDVSTNFVALKAMLLMTARAEVPTIIAGDSAVIGFNPTTWDALLKRTEELQAHDPYKLPEAVGPDPYEGVD